MHSFKHGHFFLKISVTKLIQTILWELLSEMGRLGIMSWNVMILNVFLISLFPGFLHNEFESSICAQLTRNFCKFGIKLKLTFQRVYLRKWNCVCDVLFWVLALFLQIRTSFLSLFGTCLSISLSSTGKFPERPPSVFATTNRLFSVFFRRYDALNLEWDTEQETIKSGKGDRSISTGSIEVTFISSGKIGLIGVHWCSYQR